MDRVHAHYTLPRDCHARELACGRSQVKFEVATHRTFLFKRGRRKGEVDERLMDKESDQNVTALPVRES